MAQKLQYPNTRRVDHVDTYFGVKVPDPYRWLEDDNAPETMKWVEAENKVTFKYLDKIPFRSKIKARLENSSTIPGTALPSETADISSSARTTAFKTRACSTCRKVWKERRNY